MIQLNINNDETLRQINEKMMKKILSTMLLVVLGCFPIEGKERKLSSSQSSYKKRPRPSNKSSSYKKSHSKKKLMQEPQKNAPLSYVLSEIGSFSLKVPSTWQQFTDKTVLPTTLIALYLEPSKQHNLAPTLSIAIDNTHLSMKDYVDAALRYHQQNNATRLCRIEGSLNTPTGRFTVIHLEQSSDVGLASLLQAITVIDGEAYVINGSCPKERFEELAPIFIHAMSSFKIKSYKALLDLNTDY